MAIEHNANGVATLPPAKTKTSNERREKETLFQKVKMQLITKEDPFHVHKLLGILCLLSFVWRFSQFRIENADDMGFAFNSRYHSFTVPTLLLHLLLSTSSFVFKLPRMRIKQGSRIWPEYRLHSIIFASRSIACMALNYYEDQQGVTEPNYMWNLAIVLAAIALADLASWSVGKEYRSNSVRGVAGAPPYVKMFASWVQFGATAYCLFGSRNYSFYFIMLGIIQCTAFLGTLIRKNLLPDSVVIAIYSTWLAFGSVVGSFSSDIVAHKLIGTTIACTACVWRMSVPKPFNNKYVIWLTMGLGLRSIRSNQDLYQRIEQEPQLLLPFAAIVVFITFVFALLKCIKESKESEEKTAGGRKKIM